MNEELFSLVQYLFGWPVYFWIDKKHSECFVLASSFVKVIQEQYLQPLIKEYRKLNFVKHVIRKVCEKKHEISQNLAGGKIGIY